MPDQRLINYIQQELQKGFSPQQIQQNLLRNGYSQQQISEAYNTLLQTQQQQPVQQKEVKERAAQLVSFITAQLKQGYALQQVQQYLLQQGYAQQEIIQATNTAYNTQPQKQGRKLPTFKINSRGLFMWVIILCLGGIVTAAVWYLVPTTQETLLKITMSLDQKTVQPGQTMYFSTKISGLPEKRKENVEAVFSVADDMTKQNVDQWKEEYLPTEIIKTNMKYLVPSKIKPGKYSLSIEIKYGELKEEKNIPFSVIIETLEATCFDGKKNQNEEDIDCGGVCKSCIIVQATEDVEDYTFVEAPNAVSVTIPQTTDIEKELFNKATNALSAEEGISLCKQITLPYNKYMCIHDLAQKFNQVRMCSEIIQEDETASSTRDRCYYNFVVTQNDFTLCDKFTNPYLVQVCYNLKKIDEISKTSSSDINALGAIAGFKIEDT